MRDAGIAWYILVYFQLIAKQPYALALLNQERGEWLDTLHLFSVYIYLHRKVSNYALIVR